MQQFFFIFSKQSIRIVLSCIQVPAPDKSQAWTFVSLLNNIYLSSLDNKVFQGKWGFAVEALGSLCF